MKELQMASQNETDALAIAQSENRLLKETIDAEDVVEEFEKMKEAIEEKGPSGEIKKEEEIPSDSLKQALTKLTNTLRLLQTKMQVN